MTNLRKLDGQTFGRLVVTSRHPKNTSGGRARWICMCQCGKEHTAPSASLVSGFTQSCGCLRAETIAASSTKHGHAGRKTKDPAYRSWAKMLHRCRNSKFGATVDPSWLDYKKFREDMGARPDGTSLARIGRSGNYEPGNCRWAGPGITS